MFFIQILAALLFGHIRPFLFGYGPSLGFVELISHSGGERFDSPDLCNFAFKRRP